MSQRELAVKSYGWEWITDMGMTMPSAAARLARQGFDTVLTQNLIDPLPGSAVEQQPPTEGYDDGEWTQHLHEAGLTVYQTTAFFNDPEALARPGANVPIDQHGRPFERFGWYAGVNPCDEAYVDGKIELIGQAIEASKPDGLFVSFFRWPGFWEMWLPDAPGFVGTRREDILEFSFDDVTLARFEEHTGLTLPAGGTAAKAAVLLNELRDEWSAFKSSVLQDIMRRLRARVDEAHPGVTFMLNGFGLGDQDFGGVTREVLAQRIEDLEEHFDVIELMFYFQISKRDPSTWIPERIAEARRQTGKTLWADLQAGAEYLEPLYEAGKRERVITPEQWREAVTAVERSGADGLLVYSWRDLLRDEEAGGERVRVLQQYKDGSLA